MLCDGDIGAFGGIGIGTRIGTRTGCGCGTFCFDSSENARGGFGCGCVTQSEKARNGCGTFYEIRARAIRLKCLNLWKLWPYFGMLTTWGAPRLRFFSRGCGCVTGGVKARTGCGTFCEIKARARRLRRLNLWKLWPYLGMLTPWGGPRPRCFSPSLNGRTVKDGNSTYQERAGL